MATLAADCVAVLDTLSGGVEVEADHDFVRFSGGPFQGRHRWPDYAAFIEPTLEPREQERIYRLWVRALGARHYVPFFAGGRETAWE
jgi:hypothetical protein